MFIGMLIGDAIKQANGRKDAQRDLDRLHDDYNRATAESVARGMPPEYPEQFLNRRLGPEWYTQYDHMLKRSDGREHIV